MKKTLLLITLFTAVFAGQSQTKTTGVVTLTTGMTAKIDLDNSTTTATLTFTGPSDRWFGLQFGSFGSSAGMQSGQDVVYYNGTTLVDAKMNGIGVAPSTDATNNWTVSSNTVSGTTRTIVATRAFSTGDTNDYTFVYANADVDFAWAKGSTANSFSIAYHGSRGYAINNSLTLGINGFQKPEVKIYPNPVASVFSIETEIPLTAMRMYNIDGKLVLETKVNDSTQTFDISHLTQGVYFVELESVEGTLYKKLIKE